MAASNIADLPLPPIARKLPAPDCIYPTPQQSKEDEQKHGGVFTYKLGTGRITVFAHPSLYKIVFHSQVEYDAISVDEGAAHIAEKWFQIPADFHGYTRQGLDATRKSTLNPKTCRVLNDDIGAALERRLRELPDSGDMPVVKLAKATFLPVNDALFGPGVVPPEAEDWLHTFDGKLPLILYSGIDTIPEAKEAYEKIVSMFEQAILRGDHLPNSGRKCPVLQHRLAVLPKSTDSRLMAKFMVSMFWAPQANTLPMTFWTIAHILNDPVVQRRVEQEARAWNGGRRGAGPSDAPLYNTDELPFIGACLKEALRMYIALEHPRKVLRDFSVHDPVTGKDYRIPAGDRVTLMSYLRHYDANIYPDPSAFRPQRWDNADLPADSWWPFSKGRYSCSGQHLALLEIPTLIALFFREFDAELQGLLPQPGWNGDDGNFWVAPRCGPLGWPYGIDDCRVRYRRRTPATSKM